MSAVLVPTSLDDGRVLDLLDIWERWMRESAGSTMELGYALQCRQFQANPGAYWEHTFADSVEAAEYGQAAAINAAIDALEAPRGVPMEARERGRPVCDGAAGIS
jgi:hypothetical protein